MREIKFKGWDRVRKKWVSDFVIDPFGLIRCSGGSANLFYNGLHETKLVICQFTGIVDRNGKEIYEGDIVSEGYNNKYGTFVVKWDECGFNLNTGGDGSFEIVGNMYERHGLTKLF